MGYARGYDDELFQAWRDGEIRRKDLPEEVEAMAEQAPLVARSVTPPSPSGRGGTTLLRQRAPRSFLYRVCYDPPPMNTPVRVGETIEGSRTMRNRPYPVLKCSSAMALDLCERWRAEQERCRRVHAAQRLSRDPGPSRSRSRIAAAPTRPQLLPLFCVGL